MYVVTLGPQVAAPVFIKDISNLGKKLRRNNKKFLCFNKKLNESSTLIITH